MDARSEKFIDFLRDKNVNFFEIRSMETMTAFLHTENQIETKIIFNDSLRVDIYYELANCSNILNHEQLLTLLNQLNENNAIKYFWAEAGQIVANITYWADEESFNPNTLFNLYFVFFKMLIDNHIVDQVMKINERIKENTKVFNYIQNIPKAALVSAVKSEYERIKGNCIYTPAMGEFGSFEFAGALLIWKYCRKNVRSNLNVYGEVMITLGETIGCAYNCMPAGEWSDKIDVVINNNDLLDYTEWNQIYNYLKENFTNEIPALEFNMGKMSRQQRADVYANFARTYNSLPDFNSIFKYYTRQGLRLKNHMPFDINS